MKKLLSLLTLAVLFGTVSGKFAYATQDEGTTGANAKREIPGALGYVPYKELQLVRWAENGPNAATGGNLSAGDVVAWDCVSDDGVTIGLVGAVNSTDAVAGVVVSTLIQSADTTGTTPGVDYGRRNWGYIQTRGQTTKLNMINGNAIVGSSIVASTTARNATSASVLGVSNTGVKIMGITMDASASGTATDAMISL